jgi:NADH:ubiquinone reductase (H+-translocating)
MMTKPPLVVIVGGGSGGLAAAKGLECSSVDVLLIDRSNHHVFQPLLYQVATSVLAPGQIASPLRSSAALWLGSCGLSYTYNSWPRPA